MVRDLETIYLRDLGTVRREVELYSSDEALWRQVPGLSSCGGTLVLHLAGNLRHFVGAIVGGSGYVRDRDSEFSSRNVPRNELLGIVDAAIREVSAAFGTLNDDRLDEMIAIPQFGKSLSMRRLLIHLSAHLSFHTGQIDYHRRLVSESAESAGPVTFTRLFD